MKPAIIISLALALSACSGDVIDPIDLESDSNSVVQDQDQPFDKLGLVRLNDIAMQQVLSNPFILPVSWELDFDSIPHDWQVVLDGLVVAEGNQTQTSANISVDDLEAGSHILKLLLCNQVDQCTQSQPVLLNLVAEDESNTNSPDVNQPDDPKSPDGTDVNNDKDPDSNSNTSPDGNTGSNTNDASEEIDSVIQKYFNGENPNAYLVQDALAFYDVDRFGSNRTVRNDLSGSLQGMVQFVQSHSVNPNGNDANNHPDVVAQRQALLLFTPMLDDQVSYSVVGRLNGDPLGELQLSHPNLLPKSDYANSDGRTDVVYSKRSYHAVLPWNWMKPGLALEFVAENTTGALAANNITFAAPAELVLHNIRLGMLTTPPRSEDHKLITEAVVHTTDYFQTIPVSKLINAHYQEMQLNKVIISNGTIYDQVSSDTGDVYSGDMRQNVAKEQISTGINEANWGRSSTVNRESNPQLTARITMHHAQGNYQNGVQAHGLSGGAGIGTLYSSHGNELSHELGHNYGLGHYPGQNGNDYFWAAHHADSGWGYIAHRNRMRANVHWTAGNSGIDITGEVKSSEVFANTYSYNKDAMSGGSVVSANSAYTHHTGYSTNKIQQWLAPKWIADTAFSTGYKKWENNQFVDANGAGQYRIPKKVGVPVITLLGGYDPTSGQQKAVLYPAFVSNYGNVFDLAENSISTSQCAMDVTYRNGQIEKIALDGSRVQSSYINKFHINLETSRQPEAATLYCYQNGSKNVLASLDMPAQLPELQDAVIVGEEHGFNQLQELELASLENALLQFESGSKVILNHELQSTLTAWSNTDALSASAQVMLDDYKSQLTKYSVLEAWINKVGVPASATLRELMADLGLENIQLPAGGAIRSDRNNACLSLKADNSVKVETGTCNSIEQKWYMDALGKIHSVAKPEMCLLTASSGSVVRSCENQPQFMWTEDQNRRLSVETVSGKCMDYTGAGEAILYNCHGYENQQWTIDVNVDDPVISQLKGLILNHL